MKAPPRGIVFILKCVLTLVIFYLLFTHSIVVGSERISVWEALRAQASRLHWQRVLPFLLLAALVKAVGVACAMGRWHLLLLGQGIAFRFAHVARTFLIGRFLGTFLPGTLGLDGYKLYDVARLSGKTTEPVAATVVEKVMGLCGILLTFAVSAPFGWVVLGRHARAVLWATLPLALGVAVWVAWGLWHPAGWRRLGHWANRQLPVGAKLRRQLQSLVVAMGRYQGRGKLLSTVYGLSFVVHASTAALYYFTALAVGAEQAKFGEVVFASSIQIFVTVMSPLTIAGEGIRELVQAFLLAQRIGASESILSAALGFWAAEALTLVGGYFWLQRRHHDAWPAAAVQKRVSP